MPRYYFDFQENEHFYQDKDGREFPDDASARSGAVGRLIGMLEALPAEETATTIIVIGVRRFGEHQPFAAVSTRLTSLS